MNLSGCLYSDRAIILLFVKTRLNKHRDLDATDNLHRLSTRYWAVQIMRRSTKKRPPLVYTEEPVCENKEISFSIFSFNTGRVHLAWRGKAGKKNH